MQVYVNAPIDKEIELRKKPTADGIVFHFDYSKTPSFDEDFDLYILLNFQPEWANLNFPKKPIFIDAVLFTLEELNLPNNVHRINGWSGFLEREIWEIASSNPEEVREAMQKLNWKYTIVPDIVGFLTTRVICQIINEAFYALKDKISTPEEIDTAMKLGTNYPLGPFEWAEKIGLQNVHALLEKLSKHDPRYLPSFDGNTQPNKSND